MKYVRIPLYEDTGAGMREVSCIFVCTESSNGRTLVALPGLASVYMLDEDVDKFLDAYDAYDD